jgi:hypothetical protein
MNELTVTNGKLPVTYVAAKKALAECARVDECQEWANKAAALSSYARQAKDESLRRMADRIQARATRRCGELLKQVPAGRGGWPAKNSDSQIVTPTRKAAAEDAGLNRGQAVRAINLANVPEATFEKLVESEDPPAMHRIAELGVNHRTDTPPLDVSAVRKFARFCGSTDAASFAASVTDPDMKKELTALIGEIDSWLDQFVTQL